MSQKDLAFVSSEFDFFARKPLQHAIHVTNVVVYKPMASIDQSEREFPIPADYDTYVDPDIKIYIRGKFTKADGAVLNATDHTAGTNNFLQSLFLQRTIALDGVIISLFTFITMGLILKRFYLIDPTPRHRVSQISTCIRK